MAGRSVEGIIAAAKKSGLVPPLQVTSTVRATTTFHGSGHAVDFSNGGDAGTPEMDRFAKWIVDNYGAYSLEIIHQNQDGTKVGWYRGANKPGTYSAATYAGHRNHVHWAIYNEGLAKVVDPQVATSAPGIDLPNPFGEVWDAIKGIGGFLETLGKFFLFLADPRNWFRIALFFSGGILIIVGIVKWKGGKPRDAVQQIRVIGGKVQRGIKNSPNAVKNTASDLNPRKISPPVTEGFKPSDTSAFKEAAQNIKEASGGR